LAEAEQMAKHKSKAKTTQYGDGFIDANQYDEFSQQINSEVEQGRANALSEQSQN